MITEKQIGKYTKMQVNDQCIIFSSLEDGMRASSLMLVNTQRLKEYSCHEVTNQIKNN